MSAKIRFIARLVWSQSMLQDWDTLTPDEVAEYETMTADMINGVGYDGMGHYVPIIDAASKAWDAAIKFVASGGKDEEA